jgi:hypothetical protein
MIAGLLIGKNDNYEKCARALFENWYELLAGYTLFSCPGANIQNIRQIAQVSALDLIFLKKNKKCLKSTKFFAL